MFAVHLVTFLHKWVPLAQSVLGKQFIRLCPAHLGALSLSHTSPSDFRFCAKQTWSPASSCFMSSRQLLHELPAMPCWWGSSQTWWTTYRIRGSLRLQDYSALLAAERNNAEGTCGAGFLRGTCTEGPEQQGQVDRAHVGWLQLSPTQSAHSPWPTVPPPAWVHSRLPLGALGVVSGGPGRAGSWWLPAGGGRRPPGLPGLQRPGPAAPQRSRLSLPFSPPAEVGFGPPLPAFPSGSVLKNQTWTSH